MFKFLIIFFLSFNLFSAEWQTTNIQLLTGNSFTDPFSGKDNIEKETLTFEHVSGWEYGDHFFFVDILDFDNSGNQELYLEWHPRISMGKIFDFADKERFIQDVLIALEINRGSVSGSGVSSAAYLYGLGINLNVPGFNVFGLNMYIKDTLSIDDTTFMIAPYWSTDFMLGSTRWVFSGFFEFHAKEKKGANEKKAHIHVSPQLLLDVGHFWGQSNKILAGTEFTHWSKKYGVEISVLENTESNFQLMVKWVL